MLLGLLRPSQGDVQLFGTSFSNNRASLLARIGSLVETTSLYPHLTGRENLEVMRRMLNLESAAITRALVVVDFESEASRLVKQYSLGMRQRPGLAMALLGNPGLLILNEPTYGLDPAGILEMRELLRGMPKEHGTFGRGSRCRSVSASEPSSLPFLRRARRPGCITPGFFLSIRSSMSGGCLLL